MTEIDGVKVDSFITSRREDGTVEMDILGLNEAINSSAECSTLNCTNRVAGSGICSPCFMASLLDNKVWLDSRKGYVRLDQEHRYYA